MNIVEVEKADGDLVTVSMTALKNRLARYDFYSSSSLVHASAHLRQLHATTTFDALLTELTHPGQTSLCHREL